MRHLNKGRKLKRTHSHRKALMRSLATALFEHKKIKTTEAKAKELRPYAERLITKAKTALAREKQGLLADGQKIDVHTRRVVSRYLSSKAVLQELFDSIAPAVEERNGGYCRIIKTGIRRGDAAREAIIELVDWSAPADGSSSLKPKKKRRSKKSDTKAKAQVEDKNEEIVEETVDTEETTEFEEMKLEDVPDQVLPTTEEEAKEEEAKEEVQEETMLEDVPAPELPKTEEEAKEEAKEEAEEKNEDKSDSEEEEKK